MPTVTEFREGFFGVRSNRFLVEGVIPKDVGVNLDADSLKIYIKGADLPGSTIGSINISWQGRVVKFSGDRQYADWVIQVYDSNVKARDLRTAFEAWIDAMDSRNGHQIDYNLTENWSVRYSDILQGKSYTPNFGFEGDGSQFHSDFNKAIRLVNCWPVDLGAIALNYDAADSFSEFTVQLAYDYWEPVP